MQEYSIKYKNKLIFSAALILISLLFSGNAAAAEISLEQAVNHGLENNLEIRQQQNTVKSKERQLEIIRAQEGWQIEVSANYNEIISQPENNSLNTAGIVRNNTVGDGVNSSLSINRNFSSGISLSQTAEFDDQGENDYTVNISYPLFKGVPTELEKSYYQNEQELLKAQNNLDTLIEEKISEWLETYLQLTRLEKNKETADLRLKTAEKTLSETKKLYAASQISKTELNKVEAEYLDAENSYLEINSQFENTLKSFKLVLNLAEDQEVSLDEEGYLAQIRTQLINYQQFDFEKMYQSLLAADYDLKSAAVNLELQKKQLQWFQNEGRADINLEGSYNYSSETSTAGIIFSYDLFDGGQREFNQQNLKSNLKLAEDKYNNLKENKKLALEKQLNTLNITERKVESAELKLENAENNLKLAAEQYQLGLITGKAFKQQEISYQQSQINYQQAEDNLFIEKLNLTMLINNQAIDKNRGVK